MTTASVKVALAFKPGVRVTDVDGVHEVAHHIHVRG